MLRKQLSDPHLFQLLGNRLMSYLAKTTKVGEVKMTFCYTTQYVHHKCQKCQLLRSGKSSVKISSDSLLLYKA